MGLVALAGEVAFWVPVAGLVEVGPVRELPLVLERKVVSPRRVAVDAGRVVKVVDRLPVEFVIAEGLEEVVLGAVPFWVVVDVDEMPPATVPRRSRADTRGRRMLLVSG